MNFSPGTQLGIFDAGMEHSGEVGKKLAALEYLKNPAENFGRLRNLYSFRHYYEDGAQRIVNQINREVGFSLASYTRSHFKDYLGRQAFNIHVMNTEQIEQYCQSVMGKKDVPSDQSFAQAA